MANTIWTKEFWKDAGERIFFTVVQVLLGLLTVDAGLGLANLDLSAVLVTVAVAALGVLVKAGIAAQVGGTVSPASLAPSDTGV